MSLEKMTPADLRRKLAGIEDPVTKLEISDSEEIKNVAVRFASILAQLFGPDLDRLTLWGRIGSALETSVKKSNDSVLIFINHCLDHVKAQSGAVASSAPLLSIIELVGARPDAWQKSFLAYISLHHNIIVVLARKRWNDVKEKKVEL